MSNNIICSSDYHYDVTFADEKIVKCISME